MGLLDVCLVVVLHLFLCLRVHAVATIKLDLGYAQYQGTVDTNLGITNFLGIRYAAAPVGELRWAAPQPPPTQPGLQQAASQPNECYQAGLGSTSTSLYGSLEKRDVIQSEDCLFLNVHVPGTTVNTTASEGLPVLVWIHGGGYAGLSASAYDGSNLVFQSQNSVIAVVIQYRLGLFGFLPGAEVKAGGALNAGLLDQQFALKWVQNNIHKFGGDPTRVTVWGQSAGGGSVLNHVVANGGNTQPSLFKYAITNSAGLSLQYNYSDPIPEWLYSKAVSGAGCSSSSDKLSCLRNASASTLSDVNNHLESEGFYCTAAFVPVVDGELIVENPAVTLAKGSHNGEALYSVTNSNEGALFVQKSLTMNTSQYIMNLWPTVQAGQADSLAALYEDFGTNFDQAVAIMSESMFQCPSYYLASSFGQNAWKAEFSVPPATHGSDIGYYFTTSTSPFVTAFSNSFLAMVQSGNPTATHNPEDTLFSQWSSWNTGDAEMIFNVTSSGSPHLYMSTTNSGLLYRCAAWLSFTTKDV